MLGKVTVVSSDFERHKEFKSGKDSVSHSFIKTQVFHIIPTFKTLVRCTVSKIFAANSPRKCRADIDR